MRKKRLNRKFKLWILENHEDKVQDLIFSNSNVKAGILRKLKEEYVKGLRKRRVK